MPTTTVAIAAPDALLVSETRWHWIVCPVSSDARLWLSDCPYCEYSDGGTYVVRGFDNAVRVFDGLTDAGLTVG